MNIIDAIFLLGFSGIALASLASFLFFAVPHILPGARGKAKRQLNALEVWGDDKNIKPLRSKGAGYFEAGDYVGVESAYLAARKIIDTDPVYGDSNG